MVGAVLRHRQHDEVGEQQPVAVEVARRDRGLLLRADDERCAAPSRRAAAPPRCRRRARARAPERRRHALPPRRSRHATAPASPPPQRRQPTVSTPAKAAVSRWSEAACRPARDSSSSVVDGGRDLHDLGIRRPSPPHRDDDDAPVAGEQLCDVARDRGLPDALAGADDRRATAGRTARTTGARSGSPSPRTGARAASTRLASRIRSGGPSTGSSERSRTTSGVELDDRLVERLQRAGRRSPLPAQLLGAADEHGRDHVVRQHGERVAYDGSVVLAVDHGDRSHPPARRCRGALIPATSPHARSGPCTSRTRRCRSRTG